MLQSLTDNMYINEYAEILKNSKSDIDILHPKCVILLWDN